MKKTALDNIDALYKSFADKHHAPGYAYGIVAQGELIKSASGGYANLQDKIPANTQTMFRIASMTKSFTAMAIMQLRDQGKLRLDDEIKQYLPAMHEQGLTQDSKSITVRDLLIHVAGMPQDDPWADRKLAMKEAELVSFLQNGISFSNANGVGHEYSNLGYSMLGYIIGQVSGIPYQEYIANNIWQPLQMQQASWEYDKIPHTHLATGYRWRNSQWFEQPMLHDGIFGAMGGMFTSVDSFAKYICLHLAAWPPRDEAEAGPLKRASLREMHQPNIFSALDTQFEYASGETCAMVTAYGYGLRWYRDNKSRIYIGHSGGLPGFGCNWLFMPEYGIAAMFFANVTYLPAIDVNFDALSRLISQMSLSPRKIQTSSVLAARQTALMKLLPAWERAESSDIFAENFFLDNVLCDLKLKTQKIFDEIGKIVKVEDLIPEDQLRGCFTIQGDKARAKINFTLSPEKIPLIQNFKIQLLQAE